MLTAMDDVVGNLIQTLKDVGIYDNTIVIFSSDNGGVQGMFGNTPLRGNISENLRHIDNFTSNKN